MAIPIIKKMKKDDIENCTRSKIDHSVIYNLDSDAAMIWDKEQIYLKNYFFTSKIMILKISQSWKNVNFHFFDARSFFDFAEKLAF